MSNEEKWVEILEKFRASGKSQRVFSAVEGIKRSSLRYWLERTEELSEGSMVRFAQLVTGDENVAD